MKSNHKNLSALFTKSSILALLFASVQGALGAVVLHVDISNPSAVTITATSESSAFTGTNGSEFFDGIFLENFSATGSSGSLSGDLTAFSSAGTLAFNSYWMTNGGGVMGGLNLYYEGPGNDALMEFAGGQPAFVGTAVFNMSSAAASGWLPVLGQSGQVFLGDSGGGALIGTYNVIPEPSMSLLCAAGLGVALLGGIRRWRKA